MKTLLIEDLFRPKFHERVENIIEEMKKGIITEKQVLEQEVKEWEASEKRNLMLLGDLYYRNRMNVDKKAKDAHWKSDIRMKHGFVRKLVDQKIGYLLSKTPSITTDNEVYQQKLNEFFDGGMLNKLKKVGKEAVNKGVAYLYPYIDEKGELSFMRFKSEQILPYYADEERMKVQCFIRVYEVEYYLGTEKKRQKKVEFYHDNGITFYTFDDSGNLIPDIQENGEYEQDYHFILGEKKLLWEEIPLIHFRYNEEEQPLIEMVKTLVDNYNVQASINADVLADIPNFIYVLKNYGGQDLAEFLMELARYRTIKTDEDGGVDTLKADPQTSSVEAELERTRKAIYEFGRGVDTTNEDLGNASGVALKYRFADLDLDCNIFEAEMKSSIEHMLWFYTHYLNMIGEGDFTEEKVSITFNRDIIINESEVIQSVKNSVGILDDRTIRENHPWYTQEVEERLEKEKQESQERYDNYATTFNQMRNGGEGDE